MLHFFYFFVKIENTQLKATEIQTNYDHFLISLQRLQLRLIKNVNFNTSLDHIKFKK